MGALKSVHSSGVFALWLQPWDRGSPGPSRGFPLLWTMTEQGQQSPRSTPAPSGRIEGRPTTPGGEANPEGDPPPLRILALRETLPRSVVIRADRFETVDLAEQAVAAARTQAAAIARRAEEEALILREAARQEGLHEGRQALAAAEVALRAEAVRLRTEAGDRLLRLAVTLAERILGQELRSQPEAILALVRQALGQVAFCSRATLRLHPGDASLLTTAYPALAVAVQGGAELVLVEDPTLARGDCLVEAEGGRVDGSVRVLLASLERALLAGGAPNAPWVAPLAESPP